MNQYFFHNLLQQGFVVVQLLFCEITHNETKSSLFQFTCHGNWVNESLSA